MAKEKDMTVKTLRETHKVSEHVKESLKEFNRKKRAIMDSLKEGDKTIAQLSKTSGMDKAETLYITMSLVKYGSVAVGEVDDMDEYYTYKLKVK